MLSGLISSMIFISLVVPYNIMNHCMIVSYDLWNPIISVLCYPTFVSFIYTIIQFILFGIYIPYIHHKRTFGLYYRRCEVFAVFFVFILRMKLCRYREAMFITNKTNQISETKIVTKDDIDDDTMNIDNTVELVPPYGTYISEDNIWDTNYEISARYLYISILRLQGLWIKSAQYISSRADFMPIPYIRELQQLQDMTPPTDWDIIQSMIPSYIYNELIDIDTTPIASASIGQVHTATIRKSGEKVVIKVQHPQARTLLMDDFQSLYIFCRIIQYLEPDYSFFGILMNEWAIEAKKELDFLQEVQNLKDATNSIHSMMQNQNVLYTNTTETIKSVPFQIEIPCPYEHLCTSDVLVMSFCEGKRIDDMNQMKEWNVEPLSVMDGVAQAFAYMMYVDGPFNGDPHAGNLLIRPGTSINPTDGFTIVLLDWGLTKRLCTEKRKAFCQMAYAAATFDYGLLLDSFKTIGLRMKRENVNEDMEGIRFLLREIVPRDQSRKRIKAKLRTDANRMNTRTKNEKIPMESKAYPGEFFFFVRVNELLHGLGSKFGISLNYVEILKPYAERGLSTLSPYSEHGSHLMPVVQTKYGSDTELEQKLMKVINELQSEGHIAGAQICILNEIGEPLVNLVFGHCGGLKKHIPMRHDTLVLGFSCTKAVAATLAHLMVQQGYLSYDECVCESVWTAFCPTKAPPIELYNAIPGSPEEINERWMWKRQITLRHILTHTAGMWWALPEQLTIQRLESCEQCVHAFEYDSAVPAHTLLPDSPPGNTVEYHFMSFGWLIAGCLIGAFARKYNLDSNQVTFEKLYKNILVPRLSTATLRSGFRPCGGNIGSDEDIDTPLPIAFVDTQDFSASKLLQLQREAEAYGEGKSNKDDDTQPPKKDMNNPLHLVRGKEFLLDQRIWNCEIGLRINCPAAGGRFSASGLAHFYHDLGNGTIKNDTILNRDTLERVIAPTNIAPHATTTTNSISFSFQGQTNLSTTTSTGNNQAEHISYGRRVLGFGYQLFYMNSDPTIANHINQDNNEPKPSALGHVGVGGSVGFYHMPSKISVGIMLNKIDADRNTTPILLRTIQQHYRW
jgi:predicted unusual protein kinase regulating ubiquinone biosynthesis (AarF/ABC1/UbiB family)